MALYNIKFISQFINLQVNIKLHFYYYENNSQLRHIHQIYFILFIYQFLGKTLHICKDVQNTTFLTCHDGTTDRSIYL